MVAAAIVLIPAILVAIVLVVAGVATSRQRQLGPEHPGVSESTEPLPPACDPHTPTVVPQPQPHPFPAFVPAKPAGRHHEDSVELVPADWMPPVGADRLRAMQQTRVLWLPLDPRRKEGGSR
ncbi:hypothetical protein GCM10010112_56030 [Actinoplanes lobatus]|nr:hypothetical protein GCM10010112_56030 [Actinoplanes lobatus]